MSLQVYSESFVDVVFGDGPLGFRLGKTDEDFPVVKGFETKEDGTKNCKLTRFLVSPVKYPHVFIFLRMYYICAILIERKV